MSNSDYAPLRVKLSWLQELRAWLNARGLAVVYSPSEDREIVISKTCK